MNTEREKDLSDTQRRVLRELARAPNMMAPLGGNGRGPILSAARALARKGVLRQVRTSEYVVVREYQEAAHAELERWRAERSRREVRANRRLQALFLPREENTDGD